MASDNRGIEKKQRKVDRNMLPEDSGHGRKFNQKLKPYLVLQYLMKYTDESHAASAETIVDYLRDELGIYAERRSIYRDIQEINVAEIVKREECTVDEAREMLENDENDEQKLVVYDTKKRGYYVKNRQYDLQDMRILAESVYAAKFIPKGQAERLVNVVCEWVSGEEADKIKHDVFLIDRVKTDNHQILRNIDEIEKAMSRRDENGSPHEPEKITFQYLKHQIKDVTKLVARKRGAAYTVSPFRLLIGNSDYYLLAYDDKKQKMITYRIDRMQNVASTGIPREGEEVYKQISIKDYVQNTFSMFEGETRLVTIRFINSLLDTAVERFGTQNVQYAEQDTQHFTVTTYVQISDQFFGWLLGFGNKVKLTYPKDVVRDFAEYLDKIRRLYR